jgi:hypothetical protein
MKATVIPTMYTSEMKISLNLAQNVSETILKAGKRATRWQSIPIQSVTLR